jgi:hypothetical protein
MGENGGKVSYGAIDKIAKAHNTNGFKAIASQNLYYCPTNLKNDKCDNNSQLIGASIVTSMQVEGALSNLTEEHILSDVPNTQRYSQIETQVDTVITNNFGGRKKGSTKQVRAEANVKFAKVISITCTKLYLAEIEQAKKLGQKL